VLFSAGVGVCGLGVDSHSWVRWRDRGIRRSAGRAVRVGITGAARFRGRRAETGAAAAGRIVVEQGDMMDATWRTHPATKRWLPAAREAGLIEYRP
jgi:hypothetical protein